MKLTAHEREILEMAWDDWFGLWEIHPKITIQHHDGRTVEIGDPAPVLRGLIDKGLVRLCYYTPDRHEYHPVEAERVDTLLEDPTNWEGSDDRDRPLLGFEITEEGRDVMQAIWAEGNKDG